MRLKHTASAAVGISALVLGASAQAADHPPMSKSVKDWSGRCLSSGVCTAFTPTTNGRVLLFRGPAAQAPARLCYQSYNGPSSQPGWTLKVGGKVVQKSDGAKALTSASVLAKDPHAPMAAFVRQQQVGGLGLCSGAVPLAADAVQAMAQGDKGTLVTADGTAHPFNLEGFVALALWLDDRQQRVGTANALMKPGDTAPTATPHAAVLLDTDSLPAKVTAAWKGSEGQCDQIQAETYNGADAVKAPLPGGDTLYLLPCGPAGNAQMYVALTESADGGVVNQRLPVTTDGKTTRQTGGLNLRWDSRNGDLISTVSQGAGCTVTTRWTFDSGAFHAAGHDKSSGC